MLVERPVFRVCFVYLSSFPFHILSVCGIILSSRSNPKSHSIINLKEKKAQQRHNAICSVAVITVATIVAAKDTATVCYATQPIELSNTNTLYLNITESNLWLDDYLHWLFVIGNILYLN